MPPLPSARNDAIDLLRGLSILLVVVHHLALPFRLPLGPGLLGDLLPRRLLAGIGFNGYEAVFVFFVISGFVISRQVIARDGALHAMRAGDFYRRRAARILPLLLLLLAVLAVLHGLGIPQFTIGRADQSLAGAVLSALTMTLNWYEGVTSWLPGAWDVLWSLSIEEVFYLVFPGLCLGLPVRWRTAALLALALSLPWTRAALAGNGIWQEKAYLPGMAAIAWGVLAAQAIVAADPPRRSLARVLAVTGALGLLVVLFWGDVLWRHWRDASLLLLCLSAASWLVAAHGSTRHAPPGLGWLARMGRLSYEIYLSHMLVVLPVTAAYGYVSGGDRRWTFVVYLPAVALCVRIGRLLHDRVSRPAAAALLQRNRTGANPAR